MNNEQLRPGAEARPYGVLSAGLVGRADPGPPWGAVMWTVGDAGPYARIFCVAHTFFHPPKPTPAAYICRFTQQQ